MDLAGRPMAERSKVILKNEEDGGVVAGMFLEDWWFFRCRFEEGSVAAVIKG